MRPHDMKRRIRELEARRAVKQAQQEPTDPIAQDACRIYEFMRITLEEREGREPSMGRDETFFFVAQHRGLSQEEARLRFARAFGYEPKNEEVVRQYGETL